MNKKIALLLCSFFLLISYNKANSQSILSENPTGYLRIDVANLDSVYIVINDNYDTFLKISSGDTLNLSVGSTKLRFIKMYHVDLVTTFEVKENEINRLSIQMNTISTGVYNSRSSSYARIFWDSNNFIISDHDTDLYIDGEYAGRHFARTNTHGTFTVTGIHKSGATLTNSFYASAEIPFHFHQMYFRPDRKTSRLLSFLPGGSQLYKNQTIKAAAFITLTLGGAALAYSYESQYQRKFDEFTMLDLQYREASNSLSATMLGIQAENAYNKSVSLSRTRNRLIYGTALVYALNIIDGFIAPSIGFRDTSKNIDPYLDFDIIYQQPVFGIKATF